MSSRDSLLAGMPGVVLVTDGQGALVARNENLLREIGRDPGDPPRSWTDVIASDDHERVRREIEAAMAGAPGQFTASLQKSDGRHTVWQFAVTGAGPGQGAMLVGVCAEATAVSRFDAERRRMEQALRETEERHRATLDRILEGCQVLGFDWRYLYLNDAAAAHNRRPNRELLGRTMPECWPGIEQGSVFAMLRRAMEERVSLHDEVEFAFPDGVVGHYEVRARPIPEGVLVLTIDITERKRHERELLRMTRLYDALSHINQTIVRLRDRDALFEQVCRIVVEQGGFGMAWIGWFDEAAGMVQPLCSWGVGSDHVRKLRIRVDDTPEGRGPTATAMRSGEPYVSNDLFGDPSTRPWHEDYERAGFHASGAFPVRVDGVVRGVLSVYAFETDFFQKREVALLQEAVTDLGFALEVAAREAAHREAEQQVSAERLFSDTMIESLPGVAYFYDEQGRFVRWNRNFTTVTGYADEAVARMNPLDFFLGEDRRRVEAAIGETFESGEGAVQAGFVARDGSVRQYYFTGRRLLIGAARYLVGVGIDVSAREAAESEVRLLNAELEKRIRDRTAQLESANRELESFSYSVSHDLRAPLRAINGFAEILAEDFGATLPEPALNNLNRIRQAGRRMGDLIDDLLGFSRLSRQALARGVVDMTELAQRAVRELQSQCEGRRIDFHVDALPPAQGDAALLLQVWVNLVSNAVKYTRGRAVATVDIGSVERDGLVIYHVRDNGTGFDMRYAGKLFGVFQRLHRSDEFEGTGVGLAIVRRVIERHGGRVWAEAAVDQGATFHFTLNAETAT